MMFPAAQRPPHQNMIAQQSGYLGYYHGSQHQTQYQTPEYNFQHEGLNNGAWPNHPLYMPTTHSTHAMYPQRAATGYDEWSFMNSAAMHQTASSEASSPGLIPPMSSSSTSSTLQPPLTPSPCAMSNVNNGDQETSPYYRNYCSRTTPNYHETDTILEDTSDSIDIPPPDITIEPKGTRQNMPPYQWMKKSQTIAQNGNTDESYLEMEANSKGKTRTKDKYRVVYNDHQRMELEKEFISNHYITIRLKSDLAERLGLSQRQVKIWFQNRRAKDRKQIKKLGTPTQRERPENGMPYLPGSSFQIVPQHHSSHSGGQPQTLHQAFHTHHMQSQLHRPSHPLMDLKPYAMDMEMKPYPPFEHIDIKPPLSMQHHLKPSMTVDMKPSSMSVDMKPSSMSIDMKPSLSIMN